MSSLITRISSNLQLKDDYISSIIRRSNYYYKDYYIPKSNGGRRKISQASPELKTLQYWVKTNILSLLPISKAAFAYNRGNSIKKHATFHKESYFIFHTDIKDFFPSITSEHLVAELAANRGIIEAANLWDDDILDVVSSICFRRNHLCIGTVSSPIIPIIAIVVIGSIQDTPMIFTYLHKNIYLLLCRVKLMKNYTR